MAITVDQAELFTPQAVGSGSTTIVGTTTVAVAAGAMIELHVASFSSTATARTHSVAGGGLTWTQTVTAARGAQRVSIFRAFAPAGLASGQALTVTFSGAVNGRFLAGRSLSGVDSTTPIIGTPGTSTALAAGTSWTCGSTTPTAAGQLVVGFAMGDAAAATTSSPGAGWTEVFDWSIASGDTLTVVQQSAPNTTALNPSGTWGTAQTTAGVSAIYNPAAAADTTPPTTTATPTLSKISRVAGKDAFDVTITANEAFVEFDVRVVPNSASLHTAGTSIVTSTVASRTSHTITITDDQLIAASGGAGTFTIKAFTKDAAGNWSTA